ncbi:hypothetical protein JB92DRAFT_639782 [Gautieria morchelliformis]|nr:hypothetical protein JB92DRAFT_639782 [Gautieria morchelliformis]
MLTLGPNHLPTLQRNNLSADVRSNVRTDMHATRQSVSLTISTIFLAVQHPRLHLQPRHPIHHHNLERRP